jgi:hypothetical protein
MTTATSKIWLTTGAFAIAAAAVLSPVVAQAAPADDTDSSAVGDSAGTPAPGRSAAKTGRGGSASTSGDNAGSGAGANSNAGSGAGANANAGTPRASVGGANAPSAGALGPRPLFQNPLWWFGTPNPTPPAPLYTQTFEPLSTLPGWSTQYYGWYQNLNFEACVLGLGSTTNVAGPYGTSTSTVSLGC